MVVDGGSRALRNPMFSLGKVRNLGRRASLAVCVGRPGAPVGLREVLGGSSGCSGGALSGPRRAIWSNFFSISAFRSKKK